MIHQPVRGSVQLDAGAELAVRAGRSLLPKGVLNVEGTFSQGELIALRSDHRRVAHGISNFSSSELVRIAGRHTQDIETVLGYKDYDEVVHRNHLVLVEG